MKRKKVLHAVLLGVAVSETPSVFQLRRSRDSCASLAFTARCTGSLGVTDGPKMEVVHAPVGRTANATRNCGREVIQCEQ